MNRVRAVICAVAVLLTLGARPPAGARTVTVTTEADPCNEVCLFPLCLTGTDVPRVGLCADPAGAAVLVRSPVNLRPLPSQPTPIHLRIFGARIRLVCLPVARACRLTCTEQADCENFNGPFSRCVDGMCRASISCPP